MNQEEQLQKRSQVVHHDPTEVMTFAVKAPHKSTSEYKPRFLPNVTCTFCNRVGHEESTCFGKHGFPDWWGDRPQVRGKLNPERGAGRGRGGSAARPLAADARAAAVCAGPRSTPAVSVVGSSISSTGAISGIPGVNSEQFQQLLSLLGTTSTTDQLDSKFSSNLWLIDTGASNHITGNLSLLSDLCDMPLCTVGLPDGTKAVSKIYGTVRLSSFVVLRNVYYVPDFLCNLISVSHFTDDIDCVVHCVRSGCFIHDRLSRTLIGLGERMGVSIICGAILTFG
ncbi:hypothetical protein LIER_40659 [Lithospermum erythrorhizon]|uniref:Retrovirus-related Pol polyprotein from transposon TNT 1-94-like beta-barrel domain-containing protein n=1 Tax=Lithospermum erythrorhizon TaxID=34254 RepID=A0AAV3QZY0_LITER